MNFRHMPETHWLLWYLLTLVVMVLVSGLIYLGFRRSSWL
jgi:Mg2+ and Co2+ transporter CorA